MEHPNRTGPFLLVLLLLFQTVALMPAAANPTSGTVNTFDGGQASPDAHPHWGAGRYLPRH
jgi:hypothetical protein